MSFFLGKGISKLWLSNVSPAVGRCEYKLHHRIEAIEPPWQAIQEWIHDDELDLNRFRQARIPCESEPDPFDQSPA